MERTQVSLTSEQMAALRHRARERDMSIAALLREAVDLLLLAEQQDRAVALALSAIGAFRSASPDNVSDNHDRFLDEVYGS
ncbi:MAG: ribbon-helix-helix domain-containing protein [Chloroflexi bacterium]|nr:ribbon-helix-helix domain-containing protein [Chloroflexota bacterium]